MPLFSLFYGALSTCVVWWLPCGIGRPLVMTNFHNLSTLTVEVNNRNLKAAGLEWLKVLKMFFLSFPKG